MRGFKSETFHQKVFPFFFPVIFLLIFQVRCLAQGENYEFERIKIGDVKNLIVGIDLSPDKQKLAISSVQNYPLYLFDWSKREVLSQFDVGEWYAGSSVRYSTEGRYILLQQLFYMDWAPNKDREVNYLVVDAASGKVVKSFEKIHAASFTPDEKYIVAITAGEIAFWNLDTGNKDKSFTVAGATNAVGISPDGRHVAISHHTDPSELKDNPEYKKNKKALNIVLKYKQQVSVYNAETFEKEYTVGEFYDIIYRLEYSPDGNTIFCLNIPHLNAQSALERITYINTIAAETGQALRKGFTSRAVYEPDFKLSHDGKLFGLVSQSTRFPELHIYDFETGKLNYRFELATRLLEKHDDGLIGGDMRTSFVFLPDNKAVLMTMGNHLVLWNINLIDQ